MLVPNPNLNIYPKNDENIEAILSFYFYLPKGNLNQEELFSNLEVNQIEYIALQVSNNLKFFKDKLDVNGLTISNLMSYGVDALAKDKIPTSGSKNRQKITKEFRQLIICDQSLENIKN